MLGKAAGVAGWRQNRNAAARDGKANGAGGPRGGVSEAKALAEAGSGAVRAERGGDAATARGAPSTQAGARKPATPGERACGRTADVAQALARRAARRDARRGSCVRSGGGQGERSEGAGLRLRQRPAGRRPARYCGAEPHRRAETGKAGLATWTAAGKRRMSVVRNANAHRAKPSAGHDARRRGLWRMVRVGSRDAARRDADTRNGAGGGGRLEAGEQAA